MSFNTYTKTLTLFVHYIRLHRPSAYLKRCGLEGSIHFLFLRNLHRPGPKWSTKPTVLQKRYTISPMLLLPLPLHHRLPQAVILSWASRKSQMSSLLSSSTYRSVCKIGPFLLSSSFYHTTQLCLFTRSKFYLTISRPLYLTLRPC